MKTAIICDAIGEAWVCLVNFDQVDLDNYKAAGFSIIVRNV